MGQDMRELLSEVAGTSISGRDRVPRYRHSLNPATGLSAQAPASAGCRVATLCVGPSRRRPIVRFRGAADYWASYIFTAGPVEAATGTAARLETIEVGPPD